MRSKSRANSTTPSSSTSGATTVPPPKASTAPSASNSPRTASPPRSPSTSKPWRNSAALDALGGPKTDNMYHAGWAWAGSTPYQGHETPGSLLRRHPQPMAVSWPKTHQGRQDPASAVPPRHRHRPRPFTKSLKIPAPQVVNGFTQESNSTASAWFTHFGDAKAPGTQAAPSFSTSWPAAESIRTAGSPAPAARANHGSAASRRASANGHR